MADLSGRPCKETHMLPEGVPQRQRPGPGTCRTYPDPVPPAPHSAPDSEPLAPIAVDTARIVVCGTAMWAVALVVTLVVPALHSGDRTWWPWTCVTGLALGLLGLLY